MSAAIAGATTAIIASNSASKVRQADTEVCITTMKGFDNSTATLVEKKQYAYCVNHLYPNEMSNENVVAIKFCIIILFAALIIGFIRGFSRDGFGEEMLFQMFAWTVGAAAALITLFLSYAGIVFLISA